MATDGSWVDAMRAEALATLLLTRYEELDVISVSRYGESRGYDLLVRLQEEGKQEIVEFAVETKGVRPQTADRVKRSRVQIDSDLLTSVRLPLVLFVFDVDNETGVYQWLIEPVVGEDGQAVLMVAGQSSPTIRHRPIPVRWTDFPPLDDQALRKTLRRIAEWSSARDCLPAPTRQRNA